MTKHTLLKLNKICTVLFYPAFGLLLLGLWLRRPEELLPTVLICGISFVLLSAYRHWRNAPRPYETDPTIEPPTPHCRRGHSFPSRHVFSAWLITMAFLFHCPGLGLLLMIPATALAYLRQKLHFHHKRDVLWGAALGILCGLLGFSLC